MKFEEVREVLIKYLFISDKIQNSILDVGCGRGYGSYCLAPFHIEVVGVDPVIENIRWAKDHLRNENLSFSQMNYNEIHKLDIFDAVILLDTGKKFFEKDLYYKYLYYLFDKCVRFGGKLVFDYSSENEQEVKNKFMTQMPQQFPEHNIMVLNKDFNNKLRGIRL